MQLYFIRSLTKVFTLSTCLYSHIFIHFTYYFTIYLFGLVLCSFAYFCLSTEKNISRKWVFDINSKEAAIIGHWKLSIPPNLLFPHISFSYVNIYIERVTIFYLVKYFVQWVKFVSGHCRLLREPKRDELFFPSPSPSPSTRSTRGMPSRVCVMNESWGNGGSNEAWLVVWWLPHYPTLRVFGGNFQGS